MVLTFSIYVFELQTCYLKPWSRLISFKPVLICVVQLKQVCEQGCAAMCVLALRKPHNCKVIMENGGALVALQAMKAHPAELMVQVS